MTKRRMTIEQECAALNAAVVRVATTPRKPLKHRVCGCYIEQTTQGFEVTKDGVLVGIGATRSDAQLIACKA